MAQTAAGSAVEPAAATPSASAQSEADPVPEAPPVAAPTPPRAEPAAPRRARYSLGRFCFDVLFLALAVVGTLAMMRWYVSARASLVPAIVTPTTDFQAASNPSIPAVLARMKNMALTRLGLQPHHMPKVVAFTFDDGPYPLLSPVLLDLLQRHKVKATFFVEGRGVQMQPELLRRIVMEGHELGNHSYTHASFQDLDETGIRREMDQTDLLLRALVGVKTRIMRPPGGRLDMGRLKLVQSMGYSVILDNVNPGDWRETDPLQIYSYTMWRSQMGAILLMHSGRIGTIRALPTMIAAYRQKGYQFVTISELAKLQGIDVGAR